MLRVYGPAPVNDEKTEALKLKTDRKVKRKLALQILKRAKSEQKPASTRYGITISYLYRLKKKQDPECMRQKSESTVKRHKEVLKFYEAPENATQLSQKSKVKGGKAAFVLNDTLKVLYKRYEEMATNPVSKSLFQKLRPKHVKLSKSEKLNQCLCEVCENIKLQIEALDQNLPPTKRLRRAENACTIMMCETEEAFNAVPCLKGSCNKCGEQKLRDYLESNLQDAATVTVSWRKWEADPQTKRKLVVTKSTTLKDLLDDFLEDVAKHPMHLFNARWQLKEFAQLRAHPPPDAVVSVMDFAENYRCLLQDEIQSAHWSYAQVTIHPVVNYYRCHDCSKVVTDVVAIISDDNKHDTSAVQAFYKKTHEHLSSKGYVFSRSVQWTDGCGAQYKCKDAFHDLTTVPGLRMERNFFGSRHGKNACDGESAVIKRTVTQAVKSRRVIVQSAASFYAFCKTHLYKADYNKDNTCCHYRRDFILVTSHDIDRDRPGDLHPVQGTRSLHSVKANGPNQLRVRTLTCYCHGCETGGECYNAVLVEPWKDVELKFKKKVS